MSKRGHSIRSDRGQTMLEFALIAPLLFLLVFGMLDFGKAFNYWNDETHLAAEGARMAVVSGGNNPPVGATCLDGSTPSTLANYIQCQANTQELRSGGSSWVPTKAKVCITPLGTGKTGDPVRVDVQVTYNWLALVAQKIGVTQTDLKGSAYMRLENDWPSTTPVCST